MPLRCLWLRLYYTFSLQLPPLPTTLLAPDPEDPPSTTLELDELWSFVLKKAKEVRVWIALCRKTRQVVAYAVGDRSKQTCQRPWEAIPSAYRQGHCFTDFWAAYSAVIPEEQHTAVGKEIGDAYGGVFNLNDGWSLGTHTVAMAGEFALAMMTLSCATALRKMTTDAGYAPKFVGSLVSFLLFSLASGLAQWFIALLHVGGLHSPAGLAALIFRVAMVPAVDIASLLFLAVMNFKSLKKFVADQRVRALAIRDINEAKLEIQRAQSAASRRETEERQDLQMKEQRNQVW